MSEGRGGRGISIPSRDSLSRRRALPLGPLLGLAKPEIQIAGRALSPPYAPACSIHRMRRIRYSRLRLRASSPKRLTVESLTPLLRGQITGVDVLAK